ncbi:unnamed protein product [Rotaria socialis]|uniref:Uncharacterized protein n=2 Tax=Rotaria socialis TaxID=392032 RepID=A0A818YU82_9BILA|nr:unnamed protein product [Rotaria socialis]CAF3628020.1 unnamed protein product [Rotaria socialis]CAF3761383.1 unnamed protein product [Rotaria socialis]CAF4539146.1 unnamed protein product [Rotaria socialis]CAF4754571.1 unnamed protein product [Rotaria socialis]
MTEVSDIIRNFDKTVLYAFRFGTSDKLVHLTQEELNRIPYLSNIVTHKDDLLSPQNENGEYVLSHPIEYNWYMAIFHSIISRQPYTLFNELAEANNILDALQLFDYLGIDPFPLPLLKGRSLVLSNPVKVKNDEERILYQKANISEARQTAAEFIIALSKNEYDLHNFDTVNNIFSLVNIILSNAAVFNSRFRHHTLIVVKECCYSFFSKKQQHLLPNAQQIANHSKIDTLMYLYDDDKPVPDDFSNTFAWRGAYALKDHPIPDKANPRKSFMWPFENFLILEMYHIITTREELAIYQHEQYLKHNEAQAARSGRFNTLPKRPKIDKFKHRFNLKAQKYR